MLAQEVIRKKRNGEALSNSELDDFCRGFLAGEVADYQMSALLMAIVLKGMDGRETAHLTRLMRDSGEVLTWPYPRHLVVDKHSTGGIGDKTSLILLPLCLLEGLKVPMMAGRGLGHTGGTLDKLEAVGWDVFRSPAAVRQQMEQLGGVIMGQTEVVAPLDRRLYAMRDVTATVESVPLIVGSILSKKLAEGIGGLVLDVKCGSGAFMQSLTEARGLGRTLKEVGEGCGLNMHCLITDMNSPLGTYAGNALEVLECIQVLQNGGPEDTRALTLDLAAAMVGLAFPERDRAAIRQSLAGHLASGAALELFLRIAAAQGANPKELLRLEVGSHGTVKQPVILAGGPFYVAKVDGRRLGLAIIELGGGRRLTTDKIHPWVGLSALKHVGERVERGEPVAYVHAASDTAANAATKLVAGAYECAEQRANRGPLVLEEL